MRNNHIHCQHFGISKLLVPYDSSSMASSSNLPEIFCMAFRLDRSAAEWDLRSGVAAIQSWNSIRVLLIVVREPLSKRSVRTSISLPARKKTRKQAGLYPNLPYLHRGSMQKTFFLLASVIHQHFHNNFVGFLTTKAREEGTLAIWPSNSHPQCPFS